MRLLIALYLLLSSTVSFTQVQFTWSEIWSIAASQSVCALDQYNNFYYTHQQALFKVDSTGKQLFSQSIKQWSGITAIDVRNPMKLFLFSEDQQVIEYLDNTLTKQQEIVDLSPEGFSFVSKAITSSQPDTVWLFDTDNSRVVLYSKKTTQRQQIDNIYGLLGAQMITQLLEYNNQLYIVDPTKGIFILDTYGTMVNFLDIKGVFFIQIENDILYYLKERALHFVNLTTKTSEEIMLPIEGVKRFYKNGQRFYLQTEKGIKVYSIK